MTERRKPGFWHDIARQVEEDWMTVDDIVRRAVIAARAMLEKEGTLRIHASGRWSVCRPGREPVEITSGEPFRVEVDGELRLTRMEHLWGEGYYSIDGYKLRDGMRAAIGSGE